MTKNIANATNPKANNIPPAIRLARENVSIKDKPPTKQEQATPNVIKNFIAMFTPFSLKI